MTSGEVEGRCGKGAAEGGPRAKTGGARRSPSRRSGIVRADALLARYADAPSLLDALHAMAVLDGVPGAATLTELAAAHLRRHGGAARLRPPLTLRDLFEGRRGEYAPGQARSIAALDAAARFFCRRLGADAPVAELSDERVARALEGCASADTWNSLFRRLRLALNWAVRERMLDRSPIRSLRPRRSDWREPAFFLPDRVERIFRTAEAHPGPREAAVGMRLAMGFFAGVRTAEILRARWEDVRIEEGLLRIPRPKGFTSGQRPRLVELEENAREWFRLWRDWSAAAGGPPSGLIVEQPFRFREWKARWLAPAGDSWGNDAAHNVMRHTYATMHVGAFRNAPATALNLGHGRATDLLERHYRGLAPRAAALAYWDIRPGDRAPPPPEPVPGRGFRSDLARRDEGAARGGGAGGA